MTLKRKHKTFECRGTQNAETKTLDLFVAGFNLFLRRDVT